ncbi:MAG: ATP-binding protein, partial [Myxococcota bacterium]
PPKALEEVAFDADKFGVDIAWERGGEAIGYIRLARASAGLDELLARMRRFMLVAAAVALLAAVIMSLLASQLTSRTLRRVIDDLAFERDRFEAILQSMNEAVLSLDDQHRITMINRAGAEFFAPQLRAMDRGPVGARVTDILRIPALLELLEPEPKHKGSVEAELRLPGVDEKRVMAQLNPRPADTGSVLVMRDVTHLRRLESVRRDFVANVSHELRTPVSVLLAMSETLLRDDLEDPKRLRGFIEAMNRNAERLSELISDLLDISRLESGKYRLELEPVSIFGVALHVIDHLSERAHKKEQTIDVDVDIELLVFADSKALDQILYNVVDNAIKYCPVGGEIIVRASPVDDENPTARSRRAVRIEVCDDGPGLPAKHRPRIFERFYRVDDGRSRDVGGTGLGLAIVKHLSAAMGGRVGVKPNEPRGSIFWVQLPEARPEDESSVEIALPAAMMP